MNREFLKINRMGTKSAALANRQALAIMDSREWALGMPNNLTDVPVCGEYRPFQPTASNAPDGFCGAWLEDECASISSKARASFSSFVAERLFRHEFLCRAQPSFWR
jgi:hypothetical protein